MINIESDLEKIKKEMNEGLEKSNSLCKNFISSNSKMIRSKLALLYFNSSLEQHRDVIYKLCAITEIIHNASLLHDDVMDNADERRGVVSIRKEYSDKLSIMMGDYLVSFAIEKLLPLKNFIILENFSDCIKNMADAEINQYLGRNKIMTENEYIEVCRKKTGMLFGVLLESIAVIINQNSKEARSFGEKFGIYFQLQNDKEYSSSQADKRNNIYTLKDIIGIEKESILSDNLKRELLEYAGSISDEYLRQGLEDII